MSTPATTQNPTTYRLPTDPAETAAAVAVRVEVVLGLLRTRLTELCATRPTTDAAHATRASALALLNARRAGWWRVLSRAAYRDPSVPALFARAAVIAGDDARDRARFWRDTAADWTARAEGRPTSDAAGALSNWHELGVTA